MFKIPGNMEVAQHIRRKILEVSNNGTIITPVGKTSGLVRVGGSSHTQLPVKVAAA